MADRVPRIGVGVLVFQDGKVLLGERINSHGSETWCPPGGHLEFGESPQECAIRELEEETALVANKVHVGPWTNDFFVKEDKHYLTHYMIITDFEGKAQVMEPHKCLSWKWFNLEELPSPLFLSLENLLKTTSLCKLLESLTKVPLHQ